MPDHSLRHWPRLRRFAWPFTIGLLFALLIMTVTLSVLIVDARRDVSGLTSAGRTAEVATCYASARGRPRLIVILRGISVKLDADPRDATNEFIDEYERSTPTVPECDMLARDRGLDPEDFPPPRPPGSRR